MLWDSETRQYEALSNTGPEAAHGAGTGAVQELILNNVEIVISQRVGPKAFVALQAAGVKIFAGGTDKTVEAARHSYESGELQELSAPNN